MRRVTATLYWIFGFVVVAQTQTMQLDQFLYNSFKYRSTVDSALHYSNKAFDLSRELKYDDGVILSKVYSGIALYNDDQLDTARSLLFETINLSGEYVFEQGMINWYLGKLHRKTGSLDLARDYYEIAIDKFKQVDSVFFQAGVLSSLGIIEGILGNYNEALTLFTDAYELKLNNNLKDQSAELNNISIVYRRLGNYEKAMDYIKMSMKHKDSSELHFSYSNIGNIFNAIGLLDSALHYYNLAIDKSKPRTIEHANHLGNLGSIYYKRGLYDLALQYQLEGLKIREEGKLPNQEGPLGAIGDIYLQLGFSDRAIHYLKKAYIKASQSYNRQMISSLAETLARNFAATNHFDSAWYYLNIGRAHEDTLQGEEAQKKFADQRVRLETLKKQNEIDLLKAENELFTYKRKTMVAGIGIVSLMISIVFLTYRKKQISQRKTIILEKNRLEKELEKNTAQLTAHTLGMIHRKNGFEEIENQLLEVDGKGKSKIKSIINLNKALGKDWDNFSMYFSQVHTNFFESLNEKHDGLSQNDLRLCSLIKMNLGTKEIALLLNIETKSVKMAKYRLKKKLLLGDEEDLIRFIQHQI